MPVYSTYILSADADESLGEKTVLRRGIPEVFRNSDKNIRFNISAEAGSFKLALI